MITECRELCRTEKKSLAALTALLFIKTVFFLPKPISITSGAFVIGRPAAWLLIALTGVIMAAFEFFCAVLVVYFQRKAPAGSTVLLAFLLAEPLWLTGVVNPMYALVAWLSLICGTYCLTHRGKQAVVVLACYGFAASMLLRSALFSLVPTVLLCVAANGLGDRRKKHTSFAAYTAVIGVCCAVLGVLMSLVLMKHSSLWQRFYGIALLSGQDQFLFGAMSAESILRALKVLLRAVIAGLPVHAGCIYIVVKALRCRGKNKSARSKAALLMLVPYVVGLVTVLFAESTVFYSTLCIAPILIALVLAYSGESTTASGIMSLSELLEKRKLVFIFSVVYLAGMTLYFNHSFNDILIRITTYHG